MAKQFLIIDGYNLMHAAGFARLRYGPGDLERQRNRFLKSLSTELISTERKLTKVIFDAFESSGNDQRVFILDEMTIEFARSGEDADSLIEYLIQEHSAPKQILVISSDHRLQKAARKRKAAFIDSDKYWYVLSSRIVDESTAESGKTDLPEKMDADILDRLQGEIDQIIDEE